MSQTQKTQHPMTSLRSSCIEAMAEAVAFTHGDNWHIQSEAYRNHARSDMSIAFDALLSTLTEHASDWAAEKGNRYMTSAAWEAATDEEAVIHNLLAVLRGSGE